MAEVNWREQGKYWCFTVNNPEELLEIDQWDTKPKMCVWQLEMGEEGTLHYQGYIEFETRLRRRPIMSNYYDFGWLGLRAGSKEQAVTYCTKDDTRLEGPWYWPNEATCVNFGPQQGQRTDLEAMLGAVKRGAKDAELAEDYTVAYAKYYKGANQVRCALGLGEKRNAEGIEVIWVCGKPGTGKTHWCQEEYPPSDTVYWKSESNWWPDLMDSHTTIVFNDFHSGWMTCGMLKRLLDTGVFCTKNKGGHKQLLATTFVFTANRHPKKLYRKKLKKLGWCNDNPLWRRFPTIKLFEEVYQPEVEVVRVDEAMDWDDGYGDSSDDEGAPAVWIPEVRVRNH